MSSKEYKHRFTVFTATYNRAECLPNLFNDLCNQTFKDFEWVVVNDGSSDDTNSIMQELLAKKKLDIVYINMPHNGGKHNAWRAGLEQFNGRYVITADDDDPFLPNALEIHNHHWLNIENQTVTPPPREFWEVKTRCIRPDGKLVGSPLPSPWFDSDYIEVNIKMGNRAEMAGSRRVEILRAEASVPPFLLEEHCSNFPEGLRWIRAARKYKTRFVNEATRVYEANPAGLSNTVKSKRGAYNALVDSVYMLTENRDLVILSYKNYIKTLAMVAYKAAETGERTGQFNFNIFDKSLIQIANIMFRLYLKIKKTRLE